MSRVISASAMPNLQSAQRLIEAVADLPRVHDALLGALVHDGSALISPSNIIYKKVTAQFTRILPDRVGTTTALAITVISATPPGITQDAHMPQRGHRWVK